MLGCALSSAIRVHATIGASLQMQLGNPSGAAIDPTNHARYLIQRDQYGLDYDDTSRQPNWVSWDLTTADIGSSGRSPNFYQDTTLPAGFYQVLPTDYSGSGYDRGHMCPSADRTITVADNQVLFYMSNMVPQAPDNNQGVWANFESYCRSLASAGNELLITCGPSGFSGSTIASGVAIPGYTWKIAVVVPIGPGSAVSRITASTRVIAIKVPNIAGVRSTPWETFVTSAAQIQADTGYAFFTELPAATRAALLTVVDGQSNSGAPVIVNQPVAQSAPVGGTALFTVSASGNAPLTYQWSFNDAEIAGATADSLTISNVQSTSAGTYTVVVTNGVGSATSNGADLIVTGLPPTLQTQPTSRSAAAGSTVSFSVTTGGTPPFTYQWRKGGSTLTNSATVSGATTPTLTLSNVQAADIAAYDVVVTNDVNSVTSDTATLTVTPAAPSITSNPANQSLAPGSTAIFTVVATGTAPLSYQWRKGGAPIAGNTSATTDTLKLTNISLGDAGSYDVVVTNEVNQATSASASLSITSASSTQIYYSGGTYAQNFDSLPSSGSYTFSVTGGAVVPVADSPIGAAQAGGWAFSNYGATTAVAKFAVGTGSSTAGSVYSLGSTGNSDRALGSLGSSSAISRFGATIVNNTGQTINAVTLSYTGEQWRRGGGAINKLTFSYGVGATDINTGTFTTAAALDFTAPVTVGSSLTLDGNLAANRTAISSTLTSLNWTPGSTLVLRWTDTDDNGSDDALGIDDFSLSTSISGPVGPSIVSTSPANGGTNAALNTSIAVTFDQAVNATGSTFVITSAARGSIAASVSPSAGGKTYTLSPPTSFDFSDTVSVKVLAAGVTSQSTGLHPAADYTFSFVTAAPVPPTIANQPSAATAPAGTSVNFTVAASGTAPFSYQWRKNGTPISGNASATSAVLTLSNVQASDAGSYDVVVSNGIAPSATSVAAALTVTAAAPTLTLQPVGQTLFEGDSCTLSVAAYGTSPITYQWQRNGVNVTDGAGISGSNSATLTFASITLADAGTYRVLVANGVGSPVTSSSAVIVVNRLPQPFVPGDIVVVRVGSGLGSLVATGNPVYLDEYAANGTLVQSIALPVTAAGANKPFILGGTSTTEGGLTRSADRKSLALAGYAATPGGSTSLGGSSVSLINRVVARVTSSGSIDTSTALTDWSSGSSPRSAVSVDGTAFWLAGGAGGVRLANLGATTSTSISTTATNLRVVDIYDGQLYASTQSGTALRIAAVGSGLPVVSGAVMTNLPGYPTTTNPNAFFLADLDATVPGVDTLYVADENATTGGIQKYSLVGGSWTFNGTVTAASARGITGLVNGTTVTLFATTGASSASGGGSLYGFTDTTGYNGSVSGAANVIATAAANTAFRGVAMAPGNAPVITTQPTSTTITATGSATFTVSATATGALSYQWRKAGVNLVDGGVLSGAQTPTLTLTGAMAADAGDYDVVVTNPIGSTVSAVATLTVNKAAANVTIADVNATYDGLAHPATVTTSPAGLNVVLTYDGAAALPVNAGTYAVSATIDDPNYTGTATGTVQIAKATAGIALGGLTATYDGTAHSVTAVTTPAGLLVTLSYNGSETAPVDAGVYPVSAVVVDANYTGDASDMLIIGKAAAAIVLGGLHQTYDGAPKVVTISTTPASLATVVTYNGLATAPTNAGSYDVSVTVNNRNYAGTATGTLIIDPTSSTIVLTDLKQVYDGTPKSVTVTTTPAGLPVTVTYNGDTTAPTNPGTYAVNATLTDPNYSGSTADTFVIKAAAIVRHAPVLNGGLDGSVQQLLPEAVTLNGSAWVSGDLLVPGTPAVIQNGHPYYGGTVDGTGLPGSSGYSVTLNGNAVLRHVVRRTNAITLASVSAPPAPAGTRNVTINSSRDVVGDFATVRNLTLNGNVGVVAVPAGTYGNITVNGEGVLRLGVAGATEPAVYNLQALVLNGRAELRVIGPVIVVLAHGIVINGAAGSTEHPEWLDLKVAAGDVTLNGGAVVNGTVSAPSGGVYVNGTLNGTLEADRLNVNGAGAVNQR
jgi:DNA/RNA endonuclease G (NUC1)